jgi:hypothetical protein
VGVGHPALAGAVGGVVQLERWPGSIGRPQSMAPGSTQKAVLGLADLYGEKGMETDEVRRALGLADAA